MKGHFRRQATARKSRPGQAAISVMRALVMPTLFLVACNAQEGASNPRPKEVFKIGTEIPVTIVMDPGNKGLGSQLPNSLGVAFTLEELSEFFAPQPIPASPALLAILAGDEEAENAASGCHSYTGDSPVSMIIRPSIDHTIRRALSQRDRIGRFEFHDDPQLVFGLRNMGRVAYTEDQYVPGDNLRISGIAFGFEMTCGYLRSPEEGGCVVYRDLSPNAYINYSFCEDTLPYWRELDSLYFEIASRVITNPDLPSSYSLRSN